MAEIKCYKSLIAIKIPVIHFFVDFVITEFYVI